VIGTCKNAIVFVRKKKEKRTLHSHPLLYERTFVGKANFCVSFLVIMYEITESKGFLYKVFIYAYNVL
jgi:hypothetical protein